MSAEPLFPDYSAYTAEMVVAEAERILEGEDQRRALSELLDSGPSAPVASNPTPSEVSYKELALSRLHEANERRGRRVTIGVGMVEAAIGATVLAGASLEGAVNAQRLGVIALLTGVGTALSAVTKRNAHTS